jgi:hypothetical protein
MAKYTPKVGGNVWTQRLVDIRQREREIEFAIEQLRNVAATEKTKVVLLEMQLKVKENQLDVEMLLQIAAAQRLEDDE